MKKNEELSGQPPVGSEETALTSASSTGITVSDPNVIHVAGLMNWKPSTLLARIESALPGRVEVQLYLAICKQIHKGLQPETFAHLLAELGFARELSVEDFRSRVVGRNLETTRAGKLAADLEVALMAMGKILEIDMPPVSTAQAAKLATYYGDSTEEFLATVVENAREFGSLLGIKFSDGPKNDRSIAKVVSRVLSIVFTSIENGSPTPHEADEISDLIEMSSLRTLARS